MPIVIVIWQMILVYKWQYMMIGWKCLLRAGCIMDLLMKNLCKGIRKSVTERSLVYFIKWDWLNLGEPALKEF